MARFISILIFVCSAALGQSNMMVLSKSQATTPATGREVAWYLLENNTDDASGNGNTLLQDALLYTNSLVTPKEGSYCGRVTGGSANVRTPDLGTMSAITICMWVYPTAASQDQSMAVHTSGSGVNFQLDMLGEDIDFYVNGSNMVADATNVISVDAWAHVALTFNDATGAAKIYVDGVDVTANASAYTGGTLSGTIGLMNTVVGYMDDMRVYDEVLPESDIDWIIANIGDALPE